ncbi:hypothetical protein L210DRAFT_3534002 [Boletus edulis BED1]|uniref:Uncharacterized protein n=1 Tax=Boletus edulis BED1 TaxID=1328754 RepID=A0AAD4BZB7_BOLED|nr:hypothetical protein L210DRAFT_3534002 [Boletus edulis BED1]
MTHVCSSRTYDTGENQPRGLGKAVPSARKGINAVFGLMMGCTMYPRRATSSTTWDRRRGSPACPTDDEASLSP